MKSSKLTLTKEEIAESAQRLAEARRDNTLIERLPEEIRPKTPADGAAIADAGAKILGWPVVGWKLGFSDAVSLRERPGAPAGGRFFKDSFLNSPAKVRKTDFHQMYVENEMIMIMGKDLPPKNSDYSIDEVKKAVKSIHVGMDNACPRYLPIGGTFDHLTLPELIADQAAARFLIVGPEIPGWKEKDLTTIEAEFLLDGKVFSVGRTGDSRPDQYWALAWLVNDIGSRGYSLKAGDYFSSGALCDFCLLGDAREVVARIGGVEARMSIVE